ncbi:Vps23 core domain-containing protein [Mycena haematopus]|nr:Vps23 core domain-containing protein [Mycena haematopus]
MDLTRKWLRENLASYPAQERVFADVDAVLQRFPALRPKADVYTYDDGRTQLLLCVHGLLPIAFRQQSYNIPIAVWLTRDYPRDPPLPYVVPTADMLVKPAPSSTSAAAPASTMSSKFSRVPPVYAKPKSSQSPQRSQPSQPPLLPARPGQPPSLPPKPQTPPQIPYVTPTPPPPPSRANPPPIQGPTIPAPVATPVQTPPQPHPSPPPKPHRRRHRRTPPPHPAARTRPPAPPNPELLRLHAAVHTKLSSELASLAHAFALDAERLRAHQADLLAGEPALRDEMGRLEAVRDVCRTAAGRMRGAVEAAERNVADLRNKSEPEVDELVCSTTIVHNQLINLVAEDNAIEDTIFHLSKALNSGRIDIDRFLRSTRLLAEEQFMKRALIDKISTGIPMGQQQY